MLNGNVLGQMMYDAASAWNDKDIAPENLEQVRKDFWNAVAVQIVQHIQTAAVVNVEVQTTGTASAQTGTGTGTIS
jgi:hypothetical protein